MFKDSFENSLFNHICSSICFKIQELINRPNEVTRNTVQKSVCVISTLPLFGVLTAKLELITRVYFNERDFEKVLRFIVEMKFFFLFSYRNKYLFRWRFCHRCIAICVTYSPSITQMKEPLQWVKNFIFIIMEAVNLKGDTEFCYFLRFFFASFHFFCIFSGRS